MAGQAATQESAVRLRLKFVSVFRPANPVIDRAKGYQGPLCHCELQRDQAISRRGRGLPRSFQVLTMTETKRSMMTEGM
jgi:hypothetical protein